MYGDGNLSGTLCNGRMAEEKKDAHPLGWAG